MTLPVIRRNISPIPTGRRLGFLSKGIKRHAKNDSNDGERLSAVHSFLMISGMALPKSEIYGVNHRIQSEYRKIRT